MSEGPLLRIITVNSNGRPGNNARMMNYLEENASPNTIFILNDVRCQSTSEIFLRGFSTILANNNNLGHYAGGAAVLFNNKWPSSEIQHNEAEGIIVSINIEPGKSIIISTIYIHPGECVPATFINAIDQAGRHLPTLFAGDLNSAAIEFGSRMDSREGLYLVETISKSNLSYIENSTPTYISASTGNWNILDYVFGNQLLLKNLDSLIVENVSISDHFPILVTLKIKPESEREVKSTTDWNRFKSICSSSSALIKLGKDIDEEEQRLGGGGDVREDILDSMVKILTKELVEAKTSATETEEVKRRKVKFPIGVDTREVIRRRRDLNKRYFANRERIDTTDIKERIKATNRELKFLLARDKRTNHGRRIEKIETEKDSRKRWKMINREMGTEKKANTPLNHLIKPDGNLTTNVKEILDSHVERLAETHRPKEADPTLADWNRGINEEIINNKESFRPLKQLVEEKGDSNIKPHFSKKALEGEMKSLKTKSAPGEDGISNLTISNIPEEVLESILKLYNILISVGYFPRQWKRARIKMILKPRRDRNYSKNYRPISLLPALGKLFEKLIKRALDEDCASLNLIPECHSGFRKNRGTQENFLRLGEAVSSGLQTNKVVVGAFLDLDKAFDALHHNSLRAKMKRVGITPKLLRILSSFLQDRIIYVAEGTLSSKEMEMLGGSPQGAIGSPPIFGIFDSDIPVVNSLDGQEGGVIFADDSNAWSIGNNVFEAVTILQRRLHRIDKWAKKWRMAVAPAKSNVVVFTRKKRIKAEATSMKLFIGGSQIPWTDETRFLGCTFDYKLSFDKHVDDLISKSRVKIISIRKLLIFNSIKDSSLIIKLIFSLIVSTFDYSSPAFYGMSEKNWQKIDSFFSRSLKILFGIPSYARNDTVQGFYFGKKMSTIIKERCTRRVSNIINSTPIVADILPNVSELINFRPNFGPIGNILKDNGFVFGRCVFCFTGKNHDCVKLQ